MKKIKSPQFHGAEAIIYKTGNKIVKERVKKSYRIPVLDLKIRTRRTKAESKLLTKASKVIPVPNLHSSKDFTLTMEYIPGKKLSDHLETFPLPKLREICKQIGEQLAKLHDSGIIHGDLTTSNMILSSPAPSSKRKSPSFQQPNNTKQDLSINKPQQTTSPKAKTIFEHPKVYFIDFGLGFHSEKIEDRAVDLYLIKEALEAKHPTIFESAFSSVLRGYKKSKKSKETLKQLEKVESRGRYKAQY
jgi:tRNA A-37 threonylcarbamoyl transferase component Bud32